MRRLKQASTKEVCDEVAKKLGVEAPSSLRSRVLRDLRRLNSIGEVDHVVGELRQSHEATGTMYSREGMVWKWLGKQSKPSTNRSSSEQRIVAEESPSSETHPQEPTMKHSRELHDPLLSIMGKVAYPHTLEQLKYRGLEGRRRLLMIDAAETHLRTGYPEIYDKIVKLRQLFSEREILFRQGVLASSSESSMLDWVELFLMHGEWIEVPKRHRGAVKRIAMNIPQERRSLIEQNVLERCELSGQIADEIQLVTLRIGNGVPLLGTCGICEKPVKRS